MSPAETQTDVAVVIPCYNAALHVERALESVLAQTHAVRHIVMVDDGSTDRTREVLHALAAQHPGRIEVIEQANGGAPSARNTGMRACSSTYVQFLDADDVLHPDKLERQLALIRAAAAPPDLVVAPYVRRNFNGTEQVVGPEEADPWISLIWSRLGTTGSNLWRRAFVEEVGGWKEDQKSGQEAELMFRMLQRHAVLAYDEVPALTVIKREGSISTGAPIAFIERNIALRQEIMQYVLRQGGTEVQSRVQAVQDRIFANLVAMYDLDAPRAVERYQQLLPRGYNPPRRAAYSLICRTAGFGTAQRWQQFYGQVRRALGARTR